MRRIRPLAVLAVLGACLGLVGPASASMRQPAEGLYDSCAGAQLQTVCIQHLETMRRAGFTVVLNYTALTYSTPGEVRTYAQAAHALGMKVIWALQSPVWWTGDAAQTFPEASAGCGCHGNLALMRSLVALVKHFPATWGYYVGDETEVGEAAAANAFSAAVHGADPHHPRLFVGIGDGVDTIMRPFASQADVLGADIYPVGQGRPMDVVGRIAAELRAVAAAHRGQRTAMVLQSFGWTNGSSQAWPSEHQMHRMLHYAAAAHPSLVLWWAYYKILESGSPGRHWNALRDAVFGRAAALHSSRERRELTRRLSRVPDLPAAAARVLGVSDPYQAPQLSSGGFLQGFLPYPNSTISPGPQGQTVVGAVGCSTACTITVSYSLLGSGSGHPIGSQTLSLPANSAAALRVTVPRTNPAEGELGTFVTATGPARTTKAAIYQTIAALPEQAAHRS